MSGADEVDIAGVHRLEGSAAPPRANGELVFDAPWEGRVLAAAVGLVGGLDLDWDELRHRLIAAIADDPHRGYYESWTVALESLVVDRGLARTEDITARARQLDA